MSIRKIFAALFYFLWRRFHEHSWQYYEYIPHKDYAVGPSRHCSDKDCEKIEYWKDA